MKQYICKDCNKGFNKYVYYKIHCNIHKNVNKKYICKICKDGFNKYLYYKKHYELHVLKNDKLPNSKNKTQNDLVINKNFKCGQCEEEFYKYNNLRKHILMHEKKPDTEFACIECGEKLRNYHNLLKHEKIHTMEMQTEFICEKCGDKFTKYTYYKIHIDQHMGIFINTKCSCHICEEELNSYKNLLNHIQRHFEPPHEGKYICPLCDKEYMNYNYLTLHTMRHNTIDFSDSCPTKHLNMDMINYVFVHIPKCGGTSLSRYFKQNSKYMIMSPDSTKNNNFRKKYDMINFSHASMKYTDVPEKIIGFIRNPYSRIISLFHYQKLDKKYEFKKFVKTIYYSKKIRKMIDNDDMHCTFDMIEYNYSWKNQCFWLPEECYFIGRLEHLQKDLRTVCKILECPYKQEELSHRKKSSHKHYKDYYDDEMIKMVAEIYKQDFDRFGYTFDN
jgi:hypothetical protein